ncbi:hypothetical protein H4R27_004325 [Coemansia aciculifera]|nr:hypothetical protein H4R27_004325 [Coemansia aciculifera]
MSIAASWVRWMKKEGKSNCWSSFKEYITEHHYPLKTPWPLSYELATLSTDKSVEDFNAEFLYLAKALDVDQIVVGFYMAKMPDMFRNQMTSVSKDTPLRDVMDRVALYVNAHITAYHRDMVRSKATEYTDFLPWVSNNRPRRRRNRGKSKSTVAN